METIVILLAVATAMAYLFQCFRLPAVLGFILTGTLIGPQGLRLIQDSAVINAMAEIGILFLLFILGLELSKGHTRQLRFQVPWVGVLQLALTTGLFTGLFLLLQLPTSMAFLLGSILALSSTALVLKTLEEVREIDTLHGRLILGVLIIQDLAMIPLMTLVPTLSQPLDATSLLTSVAWVVVKALFFLALAVVISFKLIPAVLDRLASINSREVFILSVTAIGLGTAFLTGYFGLSYEAGAFIAGVALSGSLYSRQIIADLRSFRDVFATLFFVSMGLLVDIQYLMGHWGLVLLATTVLVSVKLLTGFFAARLMRFPVKTSFWVAASLFQVGEFSFVILRRVFETTGPNTPGWEAMAFWNPLIIHAIIASMFVTPLVIRQIPHWLARYSTGGRLLRAEGKPESREGDPSDDAPRFALEDRVVIAGYGPIAKNLVHALEANHLPVTLVEMNYNTVKTLREEGHDCIFGDISHPDILKAARVESAKILAITFPDVRTTEIALELAKRMNPRLFCIVRARYRSDIDRLIALGADEVIYEEFETSASLIWNILSVLGHSGDSITQVVRTLREEAALREGSLSPHAVPVRFGRLNLLADSKIEWLELQPESPLVGKTLMDSQIRERAGVNVLSIVDASGEHQMNPSPDIVLKPQDVLVVMGTMEQLHHLEGLA